MVAQQPRNRRATRRQTLGTPATLWFEQGWHQVICRDISESGAGLSLFRSDLSDLLVLPHRGRKSLRVTLRLPDGDLDISGTAVNRGPDRLGLRFGDLHPEARTRIYGLIGA